VTLLNPIQEAVSRGRLELQSQLCDVRSLRCDAVLMSSRHEDYTDVRVGLFIPVSTGIKSVTIAQEMPEI